jgi:hypothetical protein
VRKPSTALCLLLLLVMAVSAPGASIMGETLEVYYEHAWIPHNWPETFTVRPGWDLLGWYGPPPPHPDNHFNIDVEEGSILITNHNPLDPIPDHGFNGIVFHDILGGIPSFTGAALVDDSPGFSPTVVGFDDDHVYVDFQACGHVDPGHFRAGELGTGASRHGPPRRPETPTCTPARRDVTRHGTSPALRIHESRQGARGCAA